MHKILKDKTIIFCHASNVDLVEKLDDQDREAHPHWDRNDDESNSSH